MTLGVPTLRCRGLVHCGAAVVLGFACTRAPQPSDVQAGMVPVSAYVTTVDGGWETRSISISIDQQPAGARSVLAVSASRIVRDGTRDRFALPALVCPNTAVAGCVVTNCSSLRGVTFYPYGVIQPSSPGQVRATDGDGAVQVLNADAGSRLEPLVASKLLFPPGRQVEVTASGADAPAFRRQLAVPRSVVLDGPGAPTRLVRDVPLEVRWQPLPAKSPERVAVSVSDNVRTATCRFDASTGRALVPPEVLSMLAPGPGFLAVHTVWAQESLVSGWLVSAQARHVALQADGGSAAFPGLELE